MRFGTADTFNSECSNFIIPGFLQSSVYDVNPESKRYSSISSCRLTPYDVHSLIFVAILLTVAVIKLWIIVKGKIVCDNGNLNLIGFCFFFMCVYMGF